MWQKKLAQWRLEKQARKKLLQDVLASRQLQVAERCKYPNACRFIVQYPITRTNAELF